MKIHYNSKLKYIKIIDKLLTKLHNLSRIYNTPTAFGRTQQSKCLCKNRPTRL